jgi:hypothetical protein
MEANEKEYIILNKIANDHLPDQRSLARNSRFSLGLVNLIIKRLVGKGLIKTRHLNKKRIQYIMTAKGLAEQTKKSYHYTLRTIEQFKATNDKIRALIADCHKSGVREIVTLADHELAIMIEIAVKSSNLADLRYHTITRLDDYVPGAGKCLFTSGQAANNKNAKESGQIDIIEYLANPGGSK